MMPLYSMALIMLTYSIMQLSIMILSIKAPNITKLVITTLKVMTISPIYIYINVCVCIYRVSQMANNKYIINNHIGDIKINLKS